MEVFFVFYLQRVYRNVNKSQDSGDYEADVTEQTLYLVDSNRQLYSFRKNDAELMTESKAEKIAAAFDAAIGSKIIDWL